MSNNEQLPAEINKEIKQQSFLSFPDKDQGPFRIGYQEGAAEWATKMHVLKQDLAQAIKESTQLRQWKIEAVDLLTKINSYAHKHLEIKLGQSTVDFVIAMAKERDELKERAEKMAIEMESILNGAMPANDQEAWSWIGTAKTIAAHAIAAWKGKEVERPCPHCGKELSRDRNLCCRECGKEVVNAGN